MAFAEYAVVFAVGFAVGFAFEPLVLRILARFNNEARQFEAKVKKAVENIEKDLHL